METLTYGTWDTHTYFVDLSQNVVISIGYHVDILDTWLLILAITWSTHTWSITIATDSLRAIYIKGISTLLDYLLKI